MSISGLTPVDHFDAEIDTVPLKPPIPNDQLSPDRLEALAGRCEGLSPFQQGLVSDQLKYNHGVFVEDDDDFGCCPWIKFKIDTGDHTPIKLSARPLPIHHRDEVAALYTKHLHTGTCRPSSSPWSSPILTVKKKTGELRPVTDYRKINAITKVPATPIPFQQELLEKQPVTNGILTSIWRRSTTMSW